MKYIHYSIDEAKKIVAVEHIKRFWCHSESEFKFPYRISYDMGGQSFIIYYGKTREDRDAAWDLIGEFLLNAKTMLFLPEIVHTGGLVPEGAMRTLEVV